MGATDGDQQRTDPQRMRAELEKSHLLITDKEISAVTDLITLLEELMQTGEKELVIIALADAAHKWSMHSRQTSRHENPAAH